MKVEALRWDVFTPSKMKEEPVEFTSRAELEERKAVMVIKEEAPEWDEFTPSESKEVLVEFPSRPELEELKAVETIKEEAPECDECMPSGVKEETGKFTTEPGQEELKAVGMIKEKGPGWNEFTYTPELEDNNRIRGLPDKAKEEVPMRGTELEDQCQELEANHSRARTPTTNPTANIENSRPTIAWRELQPLPPFNRPRTPNATHCLARTLTLLHRSLYYYCYYWSVPTYLDLLVRDVILTPTVCF